MSKPKFLIIAAFRNGRWEPSNPEVVAFANKGTLTSLASLGYTKIKVEGVEQEFAISDLLAALH